MVTDINYGFKVSLLSEDDGGGYFIEVPDLPGCAVHGETLEEAFMKLPDVIQDWIDVARKIGRDVPQPKYFKHEDDYSGKLTL